MKIENQLEVSSVESVFYPQQWQHLNEANARNKYARSKFQNKIICSCKRSFIYPAQLTYHQRWECGRVLKCKSCQKILSTVTNKRKHEKQCKKLIKQS